MGIDNINGHRIGSQQGILDAGCSGPKITSPVQWIYLCNSVFMTHSFVKARKAD